MKAVTRRLEEVTRIRQFMVCAALAYYLVALAVLLAVPGASRVGLALLVAPLFCLAIAISYTPEITRTDIKEALAGGGRKTADQIIADVLAKKGVTLGSWRSALICYGANRDYIYDLEHRGDLEPEIVRIEGQAAYAFIWVD